MGLWNKRRRLLFRWTFVCGLITLVIIGWAVANRRVGDKAVLPGADVEGLTAILTREFTEQASPFRFQDVTQDMGIDFHHFPVERASLLPEDMGSGVAAGDFDGDGFDDLYFVNFSGSVIPGEPLNETVGRSRLFRNMGGSHFEDVTDRAGVGFVGYGMGASWGDYDNDGDLDLYVTAYGPNVLYQNQGDGTFLDVTKQAGAGDDRYSAGCAWADYDRDGHIDLYVSNYVRFVFRDQDRGAVQRQYSTEQPYTLNPSAYPPLSNSLFRNRGDGTFEEVAESAGIDDPSGRSLSASWVDFNNDGWTDLYVANDVSNNGVFLNNRDGTFSDIGPGSLAADYRGAMGIAIADFDNDLDQDLLITHWLAQENALYRNMTLDALLPPNSTGRVWFMDEADTTGFGQISIDMVGWATAFGDLDNDGRRDLWLVNGSTFEQAENHRLLKPQRPFVFWNRGDDGFVDVAKYACDRFAEPFVGRGGVQLDMDRDGLLDVVMLVHGGQAMVYRNVTTNERHWLRVALRQEGGNTFALGARLYLTANGVTQMAEVGSGASYLSQSELTLHFGLGEADQAESLRIVWPDGSEETHHSLAADQHLSFTHLAQYPVHLAARTATPLGE